MSTTDWSRSRHRVPIIDCVNDYPGQSATWYASRLQMTRATVSGVLNQLEKEGHLRSQEREEFTRALHEPKTPHKPAKQWFLVDDDE